MERAHYHWLLVSLFCWCQMYNSLTSISPSLVWLYLLLQKGYEARLINDGSIISWPYKASCQYTTERQGLGKRVLPKLWKHFACSPGKSRKSNAFYEVRVTRVGVGRSRVCLPSTERAFGRGVVCLLWCNGPGTHSRQGSCKTRATIASGSWKLATHLWS